MNKKLKKIFSILTLMIAVFPVLTFLTRSIIIILWTLAGIYSFIIRKDKVTLKTDIWFFILPFLALCFSLLYSKNLEDGFSLIVKMIYFIIFPLIFYLNRNFFNKEFISKVLTVFIFSLLLLVLYQFMWVFIDYNLLTQNITMSEISSNGFKSIEEISQSKLEQIKLRRFRNYIIEKSNSHPTYQGLWISFALLILGKKISFYKKRIFKVFGIIVSLLLSIWLFLISARMPFIALLVSLSLSILIFSGLTKKNKIIISISIPLLFLTLLFFNNPTSIRFKELYNNSFSIPEKKFESDSFNSSNVRNGIYFCDFQLIEENFLSGVGIGDVQDELNNCYNNKIGAKVYTWGDYNSHNQYAFFWLSSGILGIILFVLLLLKLFMTSIKTNKSNLFYLLCLTSIVFLSENLLERSDGKIFFFFFSGLFYFNRMMETK